MDPYIRQDGDIKTLDAVSKSLNLARDVSDIASAKAAFDSVSVLLTTIGVGFFPLSCVDRLQAKIYLGLNLHLMVQSERFPVQFVLRDSRLI